MQPIGYYTGARVGHPDADILDRIQEQFGSRLEALTLDDKATLLVCLIEAAITPQQVLIGFNFYSDSNGGEAWLLAQELSPQQQIGLAVAIVNQLQVEGVA